MLYGAFLQVQTFKGVSFQLSFSIRERFELGGLTFTVTCILKIPP